MLRHDMTPEERHLWYDFLKSLPVTVNRQKVFGPYIIDFYIHSASLAIELDGSQHYDSEEQCSHDKQRAAYLKEQGIQIVRYANSEIWDSFDGVCTDILEHLPPEIRQQIRYE